MALDRQNQLHVLYLAGPEVFVHATVDQDGQHTSTEYFKRVAGRKPRFVEFTDGQVFVAGAIKYDPEEEAKLASKARGASERPE
jgi:hypothetical protein